MPKVYVRATLQGVHAERFLAIKDRLGVKHKSEVLRVLVNNEYRELGKGEKTRGE